MQEVQQVVVIRVLFQSLRRIQHPLRWQRMVASPVYQARPTAAAHPAESGGELMKSNDNMSYENIQLYRLAAAYSE